MTNELSTIPEGLDLIPTDDGAIVRRVWRSWMVVPLAVFAIVWDAFLLFTYSQTLAKPNASLLMILFPIGHVAVGIGLTYFVVASLVNKTDIVVSPAGVIVRSGPAPWVGNKSVRAEEITDVMVRERIGSRNSRTFNVMYADRAHKECKLVTWLIQRDQAEFIARVIQHTFKVPQTMPGDLTTH